MPGQAPERRGCHRQWRDQFGLTHCGSIHCVPRHCALAMRFGAALAAAVSVGNAAAWDAPRASTPATTTARESPFMRLVYPVLRPDGSTWSNFEGRFQSASNPKIWEAAVPNWRAHLAATEPLVADALSLNSPPLGAVSLEVILCPSKIFAREFGCLRCAQIAHGR